MNTPAGCAVSPNEQFYGNGEKIWGVINGDNILGNMYSSQSIVFVPTTEADTFYAFTTDVAAGNNGLRYHILARPNNSTIYEVVSKNNLLLPNVSEKLAVVRHCNKREFWLISHNWNSNEFYSYRVGKKELDTIPVISAIGSVHSGSPTNAAGYMKASLINDIIAVAKTGSNTVELFKFDNVNGILYDSILINNINSPYGVEFDLYGNVLYVSTLNGNLLQYDISDWDESIINQSKNTISSEVILYGALQIAFDKNIYLAKDNSPYLGKIDKPSSLGTSCNFSSNGLFLNGARSEAGLPMIFPNYSNYSIDFTDACFGDTTFFTFIYKSESIDSVLWDFGDTLSTDDTSTSYKPYFIYPRIETYEVMVQIFHCDTVDTIIEVVNLNLPPYAQFPADTIICDNTPINLFAGAASSYLWQDSSTSAVYTASNVGVYWVELTNKCGKDSDTIEITDVIISPKVKLPNDTLICNKDSVLLSTNYDSTYTILWNTGDTTPNIYAKNEGQYILTVSDSFNCSGTDNFLLSIEYPPEPDLGSDTSICVGHTIEFNGNTNGHYLWQDGSNNPTFIASDSGTYYLTVTNICGSATDSVILRIDPCDKIIFVPNAFSPDNDGINDIFKPYSDYLDEYQLWIYNRWGELIFYTSDVNEGWDGYHNGKAAKNDVYVWKIVYKDYYNNSFTQFGNVVLIR